MNATETPLLKIGERRYDWSREGMRESEDGGYVLATDLRLAAPQLLEACRAADECLRQLLTYVESCVETGDDPASHDADWITQRLKTLRAAIAAASK